METSKLYLKRSDYDSIHDMFEEMNLQVNLLMQRNYACSVYRSLINDNVYVIEFASMDPLLNDEFSMPFWITPKEATVIASLRKKQKAKQDSLEDLEEFSSRGGSSEGDA